MTNRVASMKGQRVMDPRTKRVGTCKQDRGHFYVAVAWDDEAPWVSYPERTSVQVVAKRKPRVPPARPISTGKLKAGFR